MTQSNLHQQIYISTTFAADQTQISKVLKLCRQNELTSLELGSNHCYEENFENIVRQYDFSYLVHNYFPIPQESFVINIASLDDQIHQRSIDHILKAIDYCHDIGAKLYTFHPGFLTDPIGSNRDDSNYDFQFHDNHLDQANQERAFERMLEGIAQAVKRAKSKNVLVAIETEGSFTKPEHLLMQRPLEFRKLFHHFSREEIGINLNIGHLQLAAKAFDFRKEELVDLIAPYIVAMELSHNDGVNDDHLPLMAGEWYWELITDKRVVNAYKILEFRNTNIEKVLATYELCQKHLDA